MSYLKGCKEMQFAKSSKVALTLLASLVFILVGCAAATDSKWTTIEKRLDSLKEERALVREKLTRNPTAPDAAVLSEDIARLNRQVTRTERELSYHPTDPVSTDPVPVEYKGLALIENSSAIKVAASAWYGLSESERATISTKILIATLEASMYGVIIDGQTVDESVKGNMFGSQLGSLLGQSSYIDGALYKGNSYSATGQVGAGILGAVIGSTLNKEAQPIFRTRYSVKLADGSIQMTDAVAGSAFRLPLTVCVRFPSLDISDQTLCTQTAETLRLRFLK
ncbi:MAG: hypothetical protein WCO22_14400 [Betaproteobacteria bacterium]